MKAYKKVVSTFLASLFVFALSSCPANDEGGSGSGESSDDVALKTTLSSSNTQTIAPGESYTQTVSLDLSDTPLSSETVNQINGGSDITSFFFQTKVVPASSGSAFSVASGSSVWPFKNYAVMEDFKAELIGEATATKLEATITGTAPSTPCTMYICALIGRSGLDTKSYPYVNRVVAKIIIGEGAQPDSSKAVISYPTLDDVKGKTFEFVETYGDLKRTIDDVYYVKFSDDGTEAKLKSYSVHNQVSKINFGSDYNYKYNADDGSFVYTPYEHESANYTLLKATANSKSTIFVVNNTVIKYHAPMSFPRISGSGLWGSTFKLTAAPELTPTNKETTFTYELYEDGSFWYKEKLTDPGLYLTPVITQNGAFTSENGLITFSAGTFYMGCLYDGSSLREVGARLEVCSTN